MAQLELHEGEEALIQKAHKVIVPPYNAICNGKIGRNRMKGTDPTPVLINLSGKTANFFWLLYQRRDSRTNITTFEPKNNTEQVKVSKWYKELNQVGFIKRIKPKTYLINPYSFYPDIHYWENVQEHWDSI